MSMATPRLPFLYPNLFRSIRSCKPTTYRSLRFPPVSGSPAGFHTSQRCHQETYHQRYGPAAEPRLPPPPKPKDGRFPPYAQRLSKEQGPQPSQTSDKREDARSRDSDILSKQAAEKQSLPPVAASSVNLTTESPLRDTSDGTFGVEQGAVASSTLKANKEIDSSQNPLETVFQIPDSSLHSAHARMVSSSESSVDSETYNPPHLIPPPHIHPFDTYSLVKGLKKGGFTEEQSISIMEAVRGLLAENLNMAQEGLISKSDVENETYLFHAACSELRNSLQASRNSEIERQRTQRAQLQHEVDILSLRMTQELLGLKDDLKGMFNDQKISTRELQRSLDTAIQELNYQITVSLNSDGKSEVEGLRWILTRRAAIAIATSAGMIILALRYSSHKSHERELEKKAAVAKSSSPTFAEHPSATSQGPDNKGSLSSEMSVTDPVG